MRRSQAPSLRRVARTQYPLSEFRLPIRVKNEENLKTPPKRVFRVLWREPSTRKHKTWKADGTLEVTTSQATFRDDTGKIVGVLTSFKPEMFKEEAQMEIGEKEIEIQEEVTEGVEEKSEPKAVEDVRPQRYRPYKLTGPKHPLSDTMLRPATATITPSIPDDYGSWGTRGRVGPQLPPTAAPKQEVKLELPEAAKACFRNEYICLLQPTELQDQAFHLCAQYMRTENPTTPPEEVAEIVQSICDHPVLLKPFAEEPSELMEQLLQILPPWEEIVLTDATKLEFLDAMIEKLVIERKENCLISANSEATLEIIKGYCSYQEIPHFYVSDTNQRRLLNATGFVGLCQTDELSSFELSSFHNLIIFNQNLDMDFEGSLESLSQVNVYTLVTGNSLEEHILQQNLDNWVYQPSPYTPEFLENCGLNAELQNIVSIYTKNSDFKS